MQASRLRGFRCWRSRFGGAGFGLWFRGSGFVARVLVVQGSVARVLAAQVGGSGAGEWGQEAWGWRNKCRRFESIVTVTAEAEVPASV